MLDKLHFICLSFFLQPRAGGLIYRLLRRQSVSTCWLLSLHFLQFVHEPIHVSVHMLGFEPPLASVETQGYTHHFTLPHKATSIAISAMRWTFPRVTIARAHNTKRRAAKALSTKSRNVGLRDEPGVRTVSRKDRVPGVFPGAGEAECSLIVNVRQVRV